VTEQVWWEDDPTQVRTVKRYCRRRGCSLARHGHFDILSPDGTAHEAHQYEEGRTGCGIDATGTEWWWRT